MTENRQQDFLFDDIENDKDIETDGTESNGEDVTKKNLPPVDGHPRKLFIIDGFGIIYRSYFAFISRPLKDYEGNNVSALFGFISTLLMILREWKPDYLVIAMDEKGPTFRHELYPEYKATRDDAPEDLHAQVPRIMEVLDALGVPHIGKVGMEADDIIATLCANATAQGIESVMVTGDKDLLQLVDDMTKALRPPRKGESSYRLFGVKEVEDEFGIRADQIIDYLAILGDSSDNVPGIKGLGEKGAIKLLTEYGSFEVLYDHLDEMSPSVRKKLEDGREMGVLSKKLVKLRDDLFTVDSFDSPRFTVSSVDYEKAIPLLEKARAGSLVTQLRKMAENGDGHSDSPAVPTAGKGGYRAETDAAGVDALFIQALKEKGQVAFDVETTDIDVMKAVPVGFSLSWKAGEAWYVPLVAGGKTVSNEKAMKAVVKKHLENPALGVIGQNLKYDYKVMARWGVRIANPVFDTMVAAWLLDSASGIYNMDKLADKYLGYVTITYDQVVPKGALFSDVPLDKAVQYAAEDADVTWRLYETFAPMLAERKMTSLMDDLEMPLLRVLADMELEGVRLDVDRLIMFGEEIDGRVEKITREIYELCGHEFNINSPKQLQTVLFGERGLPVGRKTASGPSTAVETLEKLVGLDPVPALILDYRGLVKLKNTYIDALPEQVDVNTGRVHTTFIQTGTATGRLASRNPNLQNIPIRNDDGRRIRSAFVPERGYVFLSADYAQIELVVLAHVTGDEGLREAFLAGQDVHRHTASLIFNVKPEDVTPDQRRIAKTINFGVMYGMSTFRLSNELAISHSQAAEFIDSYFKRYHGVKTFVDETRKKAEETGFVSTMFGHERHVPEIRSSNRMEKSGAERVVVNTIIQGTAADIMKLAMLRISRSLKDSGINARLLLQVHDELIFEVASGQEEKLSVLVKDAMEKAVKLSVPLRSSVETGASWGDMH
ncbi:DNA polymerase I [Parasphaerochaeta coccoides]|uniref:DNA polymerase I n=1 Tax=Parasphaerochaeta coccoides (strain ATCC BAA-1237 / DSM 17374 / SPN1) TaxID=760011 RepID=F4GHG1_PARC1|nr:DNA polymerase I [Parasphaerochaeta coccoides]AEC02550.1 DNA polymerase I [Parasphaerochaeta coccoides DSM 17374]